MRLCSTGRLICSVLGTLGLVWYRKYGHSTIAQLLSNIPTSLFIALLGTESLFVARNLLFVLLILPAIIISRVEKKNLLHFRKAFQRAAPWVPMRGLKAKDGTPIDGVAWLHVTKPADGSKPVPSQKWIIWCPPNAMCYEDIATTIAQSYGRGLGANIAFFNYRGVGNSGTLWNMPQTCSDLSTDVRAVFDWILYKYGADPANVMIHGHSLGGGTGAPVRAVYPEGPFVSDRSFSSLGITAAVHCAGPMGIIVGIIFGVMCSYCVFVVSWIEQGAIPFSGIILWLGRLGYMGQLLAGVVLFYTAAKGSMEITALLGFAALMIVALEIGVCEFVQSHMEIYGVSLFGGLFKSLVRFGYTFAQYGVLGECAGLILWRTGLVPKLVPWFTKVLGWDMDVAGYWDKFQGEKLVLYHPEDGVIPPNAALATALPEESKQKHTLELTYKSRVSMGKAERQQMNHVYFIPETDPAQWHGVAALLRGMWKKTD
eukprot:TRINITY_DN67755_c4_g1_i1.p1 TRINITY_DN67755_c4_g1~~TRINITY_DN67755_c4_g1_i1.p1  ORF type:complete len:485 (+),score=16.99 TRINITY_DN67755_c4_g1_i1:23-1477(+)